MFHHGRSMINVTKMMSTALAKKWELIMSDGIACIFLWIRSGWSSTVACLLRQAFSSKMDQIAWSIGFKSGEFEGQTDFSQNHGIWSSKKLIVDLDPWAGAQSC
ncbi:hypothetical protein QR680_014971 [Steinernema hermaphroditum]|uniref:Uncharacterized protein n=1 Tax=Steinernema hermaphroditum TaxID=289476 RepID=A0AA39ID93_9BILA|nr:hypothetical protein QR680_014971 [Steinernema hermaphroditum]